jgi:hypothetical protein
MPTTPGGIIYPASSDAPRVWEDMQDLATSVQAIFDANGAWTTYVPTFTAGVTAVGTGAAREGWYNRVGKVVNWGGRLQFGTGGNVNAVIQMDMPIQAFVGGGNGLTAVIGSWQWRNAANTYHYAGSLCIYSSGGIVCSMNGAWDGTAPRQRLGATGTPAATVGTGDVLSWSGTYRAA